MKSVFNMKVFKKNDTQLMIKMRRQQFKGRVTPATKTSNARVIFPPKFPEIENQQLQRGFISIFSQAKRLQNCGCDKLTLAGILK